MITPPGFRCRLHPLEVLPRIERGRAFDPGMDRVAGDHVEFLLRGEDEVARVVIDDLNARVVHHVVVLAAEVRRDDCGISGSSSQITIRSISGCDEDAGRDPGAEADDQHRARIGSSSADNVPEHALQPHVERIGWSLDLAADVEIARATVGPRDTAIDEFMPSPT